MLTSTFSHINGVSEQKEQLLWEKGIDSWDEFLNSQETIDFLPNHVIKAIAQELIFSQEALEQNNLKYFEKKLPDSQHYRNLQINS